MIQHFIRWSNYCSLLFFQLTKPCWDLALFHDTEKARVWINLWILSIVQLLFVFQAIFESGHLSEVYTRTSSEVPGSLREQLINPTFRFYHAVRVLVKISHCIDVLISLTGTGEHGYPILSLCHFTEGQLIVSASWARKGISFFWHNFVRASMWAHFQARKRPNVRVTSQRAWAKGLAIQCLFRAVAALTSICSISGRAWLMNKSPRLVQVCLTITLPRSSSKSRTVLSFYASAGENSNLSSWLSNGADILHKSVLLLFQ